LLLYNYGLKGIPAANAAIIMNLMPIFGVFFSWLILQETISLHQVFGGIIILIGVSVSTTRQPA